VKTLHLINYKCFEDSGDIPFHAITIFVGENDSGKSSILQALNVLLNNITISPADFHSIDGHSSNCCEICSTFTIDSSCLGSIPKDLVVNNELNIKKVFKMDEIGNVMGSVYVKKYVFHNSNLNSINDLKAAGLKELCAEFDLAYTRVDEAKESVRNYVDNHFDELPKDIEWYGVKWSDISEFLPVFEYYDNSSYANPIKVIDNTLKSIYRSYFYNCDENGMESLKPEFIAKQSEITDKMDRKIKEDLKEKISSLNPKIIDLSGEYRIDFASGFQLISLNTDFGQGFRDIGSVGEGSKKRFFLAITEWDKEIRTAGSYRRVIRGYDEPDASLDYKAQKEIYYLLRELAEDEKVNVQPVICTHSISMINRAPAKTINHTICNDGKSSINFLRSEDDADIKEFLENVSEISGLSNSNLFFERCFLLVEGVTESNALPIIYKKMKGKTFSESGVVLIDLNGNGAWEPFLKLLSVNKCDVTLLLLDSDTQTSSDRKITKEKLQKIGFSVAFLENNVILMGKCEFEDIFPDQAICRCLNSYCPKCDGSLWADSDIGSLRSDKKFSEALINYVNYLSRGSGSGYLNKPKFARKIAETVSVEELNGISELNLMVDKIKTIIQ